MNNRQGGGRRRGRNNNGGGSQRPQGGNNRGGQDNGNRIDSRARGNAPQLLEKYRNMARDAQMSGDRVMTEYYLQFADHYFRVLSDARIRQEEQRSRFEDRDEGSAEPVESDDEAETMDEFDAIDAIGRAPRNRPPREQQAREQQPREQQARDDRPRDERPREDRPARQDEPRRDGNANANGEGFREHRERADRGDRPERQRSERGPREPRQRDGRDARPRAEGDDGSARRDYNGRGPRHDRGAEDDGVVGIDIAVLPPAIGIESTPTPAPTPALTEESAEAPAPKKRGRPRKVVAEAEAPVSEG